jgi:BirA family biotin operon repressor/biotin-[acetyl-CoA-carboxylase] ligase
MDQTGLEQLLQDLSLGPVQYHARVGSTNTEALRWIDQGAPDLALVVADEQSAGRGRQGRRWLTPPGAALAFSLVLRLDSVADAPAGEEASGQLAHLTALGALAVSQALSRAYNLQCQIKWPNDVLLERRKVCGILVEAQWLGERLSAGVLGIGLNVTSASVPPETELIYPATCVEAALGRPVDRWGLLRRVLGEVIFWRGRLGTPEFVRVWDEKLAFKGQQVYIYTGTQAQAGPDLDGLLLGLDPQGCLQIRDRKNEICTLCSGELRLRPAEPAQD